MTVEIQVGDRVQVFLKEDWFEENRLNETVPAMLEGISVPKYRRV